MIPLTSLQPAVVEMENYSLMHKVKRIGKSLYAVDVKGPTSRLLRHLLSTTGLSKVAL